MNFEADIRPSCAADVVSLPQWYEPIFLFFRHGKTLQVRGELPKYNARWQTKDGRADHKGVERGQPLFVEVYLALPEETYNHIDITHPADQSFWREPFALPMPFGSMCIELRINQSEAESAVTEFRTGKESPKMGVHRNENRRQSVFCAFSIWEHSKRTLLNTLGSLESKRPYEFAIDHFVSWYCSAPPANGTRSKPPNASIAVESIWSLSRATRRVAEVLQLCRIILPYVVDF
jgi:hypothetical protein